MSRDSIKIPPILPMLTMLWSFVFLIWESKAQPLLSPPLDRQDASNMESHLIWLYFGSNLLLVFSCFIIPGLIFYYLRKKPDLEYKGLFWLFALFILSSGITHLTEVISLWWPGYFIQGWTIAITALISLLTVIVLIPKLSDLLSLPSRKELQQEIEYRQQAQEEAERLSRFQNDLIEASSDLIWEVDAQWRYTYLSSKVENMLGYSSEEMLGRTLFEFMSAEEAQRVSAIFPHLAQSEKKFRDLSYSILSKDGREVILEGSGIPILKEDGTVIGYRGVGRDITEILSWQSALQENEERFRRILQTTSEGFWLINPITKLTLEVNESLCNMLGYERQEMIGHAPSEFVDVENAEIFKEQLAKINQQDHRAYDIELRRKNGSNLPTHFEASTIRFPDGTPRHVFAFVTDISTRVIFQKDLLEAKGIAEEASRTKSAFLANISHEIRTPMNSIIGLAHLILQSELSGKQRSHVDKINIAANSLLTLINDLLDFSKIDAGKLELEHIPFHLEDVLNNLHSLIAIYAQKKELTIRFELAKNLPSALVGDPLRIGQILTNLVHNAIKFTENGEVVIGISLEKQGDTFARFVFSIRDTGIGILGEDQGRIFDAFSQADSSTTRKYGGTGLGLAICKQLGDLMRGEFRVESSPGKGSTFQFLVWLEKQAGSDRPIIQADWSPGIRLSVGAEEQERAPSQKEIDALQGARILLAEDDAINQELIAELLTGYGMMVDVVDNGEEALRQVEQGGFDCVLMDCQMPVMDGYAAARRIRAQNQFRDLPIIALTANTLAGAKDEVKDAGMNDYIAKPVNINYLLSVLIRLIKPTQNFSQIISRKSIPKRPEALEIEAVDIQIGLAQTQGNIGLYLKLLKKFAETKRDFMEQLDSAIQKQDWPLAQRLSHTLKGVAGSIGAVSLQNTCRILEEEIRIPRINPETVVAMKSDLLCILKAIDAINPEDFVSAQTSSQPGSATLAMLKLQIDGNDTDALETAEALLGAANTPEQVQSLSTIVKALNSYDFEKAAILLKRTL